MTPRCLPGISRKATASFYVQTNHRQIERVQAAQRIQHISGVNMNTKVAFIIAAAALFAAPSLAAATPLMPAIYTPSEITLVAGGCGPNAWRGPYGGCRNTPFYGRLPNGYYQERPVASNACPPGYWRGPWGHCRNTPYHGRLLGGSWK